MKHYIKLELGWNRAMVIPLEEAQTFLKILQNPEYCFKSKFYSYHDGAPSGENGDGLIAAAADPLAIWVINETEKAELLARGNKAIAASAARQYIENKSSGETR